MFITFSALAATAQTPTTVGVILHTAASVDSGYVLFAPLGFTTTYLINKCGELIHSWPSKYLPNSSVYLLNDGSILRPGAFVSNDTTGGIIERIGWDGKVQWHFLVADSIYSQHHDIRPLPNGNVLVLASERLPAAVALAAGGDTLLLGGGALSEVIFEYKPVGVDSASLVWKWRAWDHVIQSDYPAAPTYGSVANHPERINLNFSSVQAGSAGDWLHFNSIAYNSGLDQILISCHRFNEIWIIDHSTTSAEAASHIGGRQGKGGDLLYRWGNPQTYDQGSLQDQRFFGQHDAEWVADSGAHAGDIIVFNNGDGRLDGAYSSVDMIAPPVDANGTYASGTMPYAPAQEDWVYTDVPPDNLNILRLGGAQVLHNGNVLICAGADAAETFFEIDTSKKNVWQYVSPVSDTGPVAQGDVPQGNSVFRCTFIPFSNPAFAGRELSAGAPLELFPNPSTCLLNIDTTTQAVVEPERNASVANSIFLFPNPASNRVSVSDASDIEHVVVRDFVGNVRFEGGSLQALDLSGMKSGVYTVSIIRRGIAGKSLLVITH